MSLSASDKAIAKDANTVAQTLTIELRKKATDAGWPVNIVIALSVVVKDGTLVIDYPDVLAKKIEDLEYGSEAVPPHSVLRAFQNRISSHLKEFYTRKVDELMTEMELF